MDRIVRVVLRGDVKGFTGSMAAARGSVDEAKRSLDGIEGSSRKTRTSFLTTGRAIAGSVAALGLGKLVKDSIALEATYSRTMREVAVATGAPKSALQELDDLAMKLGADTIYSAQEAGDAMLALAKGGLSTAQIQGGALANSLTLAAAGSLDLGTAADSVVNTMGAFGLSAEETAAAVAALAGAANASSADVSDITQALAQAGTEAASVGLTVQETTAILAAFSNAGIQGSDAGTSLRTLLTRLVPTTKEQAKAMDALGLSFTNANGEFVGAADIAARLQKSFKGMSSEERSQALSTIFGADARRAANILIEQGADGINEYIKATSDIEAAENLAKTAMEGTSGAVENLQGQLETAMIQIGKGLAPTVQELAGRVADLVEDGDFEDWARTAGDAVVEFIDTVGPMASSVLPLLNTAAKTTGEVLKVVAPLVKEIADAFNSLPQSAQQAIILGAGAAYLGKKAGVLGAATAGAAAGGATAAGKAGAAGGAASGAATAARGSAAGVIAKSTAGRAAGVIGIAGILGEVYNEKLLDSVQTKQEKLRRGTELTNEEMREQARLSNEIFGNTRRSGGGSFGFDILGLNAYSEALDKLPKEVITDVEAHGAEASRESIEALAEAYGLTPEQVETELAAQDLASGKLKIVDGELTRIDGKRATVRVDATTVAARAAIRGLYDFANTLPFINIPVRPGVSSAAGNIVDFYADGGVRESHVAQIAPAGAMRVWAEPETGGEAYIPFAASKRKRSQEIAMETVRRLGGVAAFANGGINAASGPGGYTLPPGAQFRLVGADLIELVDSRVKRGVSSQRRYDAAGRSQKGLPR